MDKLKELRISLIRKFLRTVFVVCVVEYFLITLLSHTVQPFVIHFFFNDAEPGSLGMMGVLVVAIIVLATLISELIMIIIPGRLGALISNISVSMDKISTLVLGDAGLSLTKMGKIRSLELFAVILASLVILIIPFLIAAVYFAGIIIKDFKQIEKADKEKQREYERKRNRMLSDIAHDLRTPMTTVSGYARALSDGLIKDDETQKKYLDTIRAKTARMNELINFLFDYVKTDSEGFELHKEKTDICELARECVVVLYSDMEEKEIEADIDIPDEIIEIEADKLQLSRVITNLINNAIKHNDKGTRIGIILERDYNSLRLMIADNGKKIDDDMAEHIFEPFYMGDESRNSRGGTGLGLSIAERIISLHGFKIKLIRSPFIKKYPKAESYEKMFMITMDIPDTKELTPT